MTTLHRLLAGFVALTFTGLAQGADHRDGSIAQDQPADIADTYAFVNPNATGRVVLGLTVNPYTVPGVDAAFATDVLYQIKIDNDGDLVEDLVIQAVFETEGGVQRLRLLGPARPRVRGPVNRLLRTRGRNGARVEEVMADGSVHEMPDRQMRVFAGRTDDPFFIDLTYVRSVLSVPGVPSPDELARLRELSGLPSPGVDLFTGLNVSALMVELPLKMLMRPEHGLINVWSTASRQAISLRSKRRGERSLGAYVQIDRQGLPAINAALVPPELRDAFNRASPRHDVKTFARAITKFLNSRPNLPGDDYSDFVASVLLPDVLRLDLRGCPGSACNLNGLELVRDPNGPDNAPIPSFNGRAPRDDFIDLFLFALSEGRERSDGVDANDCTPPDRVTPCTTEGLDNGLPTWFPFLGAEHAPDEPIPARN